jgi:cob(I)alamin adenosyltransferase
MAIYTKRGDKGKTSLFDQNNTQRKRISKDSLRINAVGAIDELNSSLGIATSFCKDRKIGKLIKDVQKDLFKIGSIIVGSKLRFTKIKTKRLERAIDELEGNLPVLKNFILPGGTKSASHLHFSRSLSRKAERKVVALSKKRQVKPEILTYLNRLSDFLFMLAREVNYRERVKETSWKGTK